MVFKQEGTEGLLVLFEFMLTSILYQIVPAVKSVRDTRWCYLIPNILKIRLEQSIFVILFH